MKTTIKIPTVVKKQGVPYVRAVRLMRFGGGSLDALKYQAKTNKKGVEKQA